MLRRSTAATVWLLLLGGIAFLFGRLWVSVFESALAGARAYGAAPLCAGEPSDDCVLSVPTQIVRLYSVRAGKTRTHYADIVIGDTIDSEVISSNWAALVTGPATAYRWREEVVEIEDQLGNRAETSHSPYSTLAGGAFGFVLLTAGAGMLATGALRLMSPATTTGLALAAAEAEPPPRRAPPGLPLAAAADGMGPATAAWAGTNLILVLGFVLGGSLYPGPAVTLEGLVVGSLLVPLALLAWLYSRARHDAESGVRRDVALTKVEPMRGSRGSRWTRATYRLDSGADAQIRLPSSWSDQEGGTRLAAVVDPATGRIWRAATYKSL
ncbi:MAG TPA: hypothetical protein VF134_04120 [Candidatus Dormibacteraeota bacterium]